MPVPTTLRGISTTAASNSPAGTDAIGSTLDDYLRALQAVFRTYLASQGSAMTAASTVDLSTADGYYITINGSTTITSFGTEQAGISYLLKFASTPVITHNGTSLILPGAANITAAAGDLMLVVSEGSGNWRCEMYQPATSTPVEKLPTTKGDILAATASQTLARVGVGTDGQVLTANASATPGVKWAAPSLTSGTQCVKNPFATNSSTTQAHGLGTTPTFVMHWIECLTGELGYTAGDRVYPGNYYDASGECGYSVAADATNVVITTHVSVGVRVINKSTRAMATITSANWKIVAQPYLVN